MPLAPPDFGTLHRRQPESEWVDDPDWISFEYEVRNGGSASTITALLGHAPAVRRDAWALQWAAWRGDLKEVARLIPSGEPASQHSTALFWAAMQGHAEVVRILIPVSQPEALGGRAIHTAASLGHVGVFRLLLSVAAGKSRWALSCLDSAARAGQGPVIALLMDHCDPSMVDSKALRSAARGGHVDVARQLLPRSDLKAAWGRLVSDREWGGVEVLAHWAPPEWISPILDLTPVGVADRLRHRRSQLQLEAALPPSGLLLSRSTRRTRL